MSRLLALPILLLLVVQSAFAVIVGDPPPVNPCSAAAFKTRLVVLDVSGDGSVGVGLCQNFVGAETVITCTSKEGAGKNIDVAIEYFDNSGAPINTVASPMVGNNAFCGVVPGATLTFHTVPPGSTLPGPWGVGGSPGFIPTGPAPMPISPCTFSTTGCFLHGCARVLSTSKKIQCTATRVDVNGPCMSAPGPAPVKELTVIIKKQQGD